MKIETNELEKKANEVVEDKMTKHKKQKNIELYKLYRIFSLIIRQKINFIKLFYWTILL